MTQRTEAEIGEIVETASDLATVGCGCNEQEADGCTHMRGGHCRRLADNIDGALRAARASADAEIAELRASLAKAEEALEPFAALAQYGDEHYPEALDTDETPVSIGDVRRAARALSDLRTARP